MINNNEHFIMIPYEVVDASDNIELLLPIYIYLKINANLFDVVYTSKSHMLFNSGYVYNSNSTSRGYIRKVEEAILWLETYKYIYTIEDIHTGDQGCDIRSFKPGTHFNIVLNERDGYQEKFLKMYLSDYEILYSLFFEDDFYMYNKLLYLYCYIMQKVQYKRKDELYYYVCNIDMLAERGGAGKANTIYKLIKFFDKADIFHYKVVKRIKTNKESFITGPHVFVRHSEDWENELEYAVLETETKRTKYFKSKGML